MDLDNTQCLARTGRIADEIEEYISSGDYYGIIKLYGIPRGGLPVVKMLLDILDAREIAAEQVFNVEDCDFIVDDLLDSGKTAEKFMMKNPDAHFVCLVDKTFEGIKEWITFPWEKDDGDIDRSAEDIPLRLLQFIGENPEREGLKDTPARFVRAWKEWTSGYSMDVDTLFTLFEDGGEGYDEMLVLDPISFYSHCEHHLAPFFGDVYIAYIPNGKIAGLSKFVRLVDIFAKRLQVQERLTMQIAQTIEERLHPQGVAVVIKARHFCMESRGVKRPGIKTTTSAMLGKFRTEIAARNEFLALIR